MRVSHFTPPSDPAAPLGDADDGWPADDIDGWLDSVVDGLVGARGFPISAVERSDKGVAS